MMNLKKTLYDLWFNMYSRGHINKPDSCGFEHVFVGELNDGKVTGFHNWIQIFLEEKKGKLDYQGYIVPRKKDNHVAIASETDQLIVIQFTWDVSPTALHKKKDISTTFVGTSPEFELALYTLCFLLDEEEDHFCEVGEGEHIYRVNIKCHRWYVNTICRIAASFPVSIDV